MLISDAWPVIGLTIMFVFWEFDELRRTPVLARPKLVEPLQRPTYRPRRRFPFRALRTASLWIILAVVTARGVRRCISETRPIPAGVDCALVGAMSLELPERFRR